MAFNLKDYVRDIQSIATENNCTWEQAVDKFIVNLTTMKPHYKGADDINFHELGQHWNRLKYKEKNAQKAAVLQQTPKSTRVTRRTEE